MNSMYEVINQLKKIFILKNSKLAYNYYIRSSELIIDLIAWLQVLAIHFVIIYPFKTLVINSKLDESRTFFFNIKVF